MFKIAHVLYVDQYVFRYREVGRREMMVQVFLTNMKDDFKTYNTIYAEFFARNLR